jgi:AAA ATPase domain
MARINPFRPNSPVSPGMFVGRTIELQTLESQLLQTRADRPTNFVITGERGIGKTSLLDYIKYIATGNVPVSGETIHFLVIEIAIDERTSEIGLIKKIENALRKELKGSEKARSFLRLTWQFLERVEAAGVSLKGKPPIELESVREEFSESLAVTVKRLTESAEEDLFSAKYDGVLILVDEADNASPDLELGSFAKLFVERLQRIGCHRVMLGLAGLPEIRQKLFASHPSSLRVFDEMALGRLSHQEVSNVIDVCLGVANEENVSATTITVPGRSRLISLAEGYPYFIQQFGYCAFASDTDGWISEDDVERGAFRKGGALEIIGNRYYRDEFYEKIQNDSYRQVLRIMARRGDDWVSKAEIKKNFRGNSSTLDNALHALRARRLISPQEGHKGMYKLRHHTFAEWITRYTSR